MNAAYKTYYWKNGKPYGKTKAPEGDELCYKIFVDPYHKRYSVERYRAKQLEAVVYDSNLFDFRHMKAAHQAAWRREVLEENETRQLCLIRNEEDRAILLEEHSFPHQRSSGCRFFTLQKVPLGHLQLNYIDEGAPFNGAILYDSEDRIVMLKKYSLDPVTGEFSELLEEQWDFEFF